MPNPYTTKNITASVNNFCVKRFPTPDKMASLKQKGMKLFNFLNQTEISFHINIRIQPGNNINFFL